MVKEHPATRVDPFSLRFHDASVASPAASSITEVFQRDFAGIWGMFSLLSGFRCPGCSGRLEAIADRPVVVWREETLSNFGGTPADSLFWARSSWGGPLADWDQRRYATASRISGVGRSF